MARRHQTIKDPAAELRLFRRRVTLLLVLMALAGAGLLARLSFLQVVQHDRYATASQDNSIRAEVIAPARASSPTATARCWPRTCPVSACT